MLDDHTAVEFVIDVTERKRAEAAVRESEQRREMAPQAAEMGTWDYDLVADVCHFDARAQEMYSLPSDALDHRPEGVAAVVHPDDVGPMFDAIQKASDVSGDGRYEIEYRIAQGDGRYRWLRAWGQAEFEGEGAARRAIRIVGASRDATFEKEADAALRESEERLRNVLDSMAEGFAVLGPDFAILDVNEETLRLDGRRRDELVGRSHWDAFPGTEDAPIGALLKKVMRERVPGSLEHQYVWPNGRALWVDTRVYPTPGGIAIFWRDITDRKDAEAALRTSEERYRSLFQASPAPFLIIKPDAPRFTTAEVNDAYLAATMRTREEVVGRGIFEAFPDNPYDPTIAGVSTLRASLERVLASRQPETLPHLKYDIARPDGSFEERWWSPVNSPVLGENGEVEAIIHNANDVTEEHRAAAALRESDERFRALAQAIEDVFYMADLDRNALIYLSPGYERIWGRPCAELEADLTSFVETLHPDDRPRFLKGKAAQARGEPALIEYRIVRPDGAVRWILDRSFPVPGANGRRSAGVASDITQRREAEERVRESEERLRGLGEASQDVLWIRDAETLSWTYLTPAFETIYGISREETLAGDDFSNWTDMILPEDRDVALANIRKVLKGERVTFEFRIRRPSDGQVRWLRDTDFPILDAAGRVESIGGIGTDVTAEKETAERMKVLVAEFQHRTRNLIGVVRSVADRTIAGAGSLEEFRESYRARLGALARVNGLLSRLNEHDRITFDELIRTELSGHGIVPGNGQDGQVTLDGPSGIRLRSSTVQTFALALHELATNAVKYGALSSTDGRLVVKWSLIADGEARLRVEWRERRVSTNVGIDEPARTGYGRELIERALPFQLQAETTYELGPDGVRCVITLPISTQHGMSEHA